MRLKCRQHLGFDGLAVMEDPRLVILLNMPPLNVNKLCEKMEKRHMEYRDTDLTLRELLLREYGEDALEFVLEYAGLK